MLEHIMRSDVFHSTLDWQSHEQLVAGARDALVILTANRELFEYEQQAARALCKQLAGSSEKTC
jgi:hypothetical protein